jgi:hypothetical protein
VIDAFVVVLATEAWMQQHAMIVGVRPSAGHCAHCASSQELQAINSMQQQEANTQTGSFIISSRQLAQQQRQQQADAPFADTRMAAGICSSEQQQQQRQYRVLSKPPAGRRYCR